MTREDTPSTLDHFLLARLAKLDPHARLVCVLEPHRRLKLSAGLSNLPAAFRLFGESPGQVQDSGASVQVRGNTWPVLRYTGDDLAFRAAFAPGQPVLVWITQSDHWRLGEDDTLSLNSLADVLTQADAILDLSVRGVLDELIPGETWPSAALDTHSAAFAEHLPIVVSGHQVIRRHLARDAALDASAIRALALHCYQPEIPADAFLFQQDSPSGVLNQYITLAWGAAWSKDSVTLLSEQARLAPHINIASVSAWFDVPAEGLARYLYLYRLLARAKLPNINNQLRGLGLLGFDPASLEAHVGSALVRWEHDDAWRNRVIQQAETGLTSADLLRIIDLLDLRDVDRLLTLIGQAETPALVYELTARLLLMAQSSKTLRKAIATWAQQRPAAFDALPETVYTKPAQAIVCVLDKLAFINDQLAEAIPGFSNLAAALDWYVASRAFELELAHAQAGTALWNIPDEKLRESIRAYLDQVQKHVRQYLDQSDHALADLVKSDFSGYLSSPRLSINVLRDTLVRKRMAPTAKACVWIVVFDGMRWDTWERVAKPRLLETFELKDEKAYLSLLPSWTYIARGGLLAGLPPYSWKGYRNTFTPQQSALVARLLGIADKEQEDKLRFFSRMESDQTSRQLDPSQRFPYNVLIFNISDDNIHHLKGSLDSVNQVVAQLLGDILDMLRSLVKPEDTVILSSDHGFTELDRGAQVTIPDDSRWQRFVEGGRHPVTFRYIAGVEPPAGLSDVFTFDYKGMPDGKYTVAIGRRWFQRQDSRGEPARYSHGGLSFAEMVVPGAVLQRITQKRIEISLDDLPAKLSVAEGQELRFTLTIANTGNQPTAYELSYRADTESQPRQARGTLAPSERASVVITAHTVYRQTGKSTQALKLQLAYGSQGGKLEPTLPREIPVQVTPQKGKVEISLGGLDDLE